MINLNTDEPIWLVEDEKVGFEFYKAITKTWNSHKELYDENERHSIANRLNPIFGEMDFFIFKKWSKQKINDVVKATFKTPKVKLWEVDECFYKTEFVSNSVQGFLRLVVIQLWANRVFLAPLSVFCNTKAVLAFDEICKHSDSNCLTTIRGVSQHSFLKYAGRLTNVERERRASHWLRLLLGTTFYNADDINEVDAKLIHDNGYGSSKTVLGRYYPIDFLIAAAQENSKKISIIDNIHASYIAKKNEKIKQRQEKKTERKIKAKASRFTDDPIISLTKRRATSLEATVLAIKGYMNSNPEIDLEQLLKIHLTPNVIKPIFEDAENNYGLFFSVPDKVKEFAQLISDVFDSFTASKRLQNDKPYVAVKNFLICYITVYLPRFFRERDGDLLNFPTTLNDFNCAVFFTRDETLDGTFKFIKQPPMTFLNFLRLYSRCRKWHNDTLYVKVLVIDSLFEYIEKHKNLLPNSAEVVNTFSPSCYPLTSKRTGTSKIPPPRQYFATFLSMLYSLEYLIDHLNGMAEGVNPGIVNDKLHYPTLVELQENHVWSSIWEQNTPTGPLDLSLLNYSPIFYHDGDIYPFEFIYCFYRFMNYEMKEGLVQRICPNDVRITQIMCETGIRQHHVIWLNKEKYDRSFDRSWPAQLAPLFVSSDKSHGEWTAIVSSHVFAVLDRQRSWYDKCKSEAYKNDVWYGFKEGAKFGRYKPLFRTPTDNASSMSNYGIFPSLLVNLEYFIKHQLNDNKCPDLVYLKQNGDLEETRPVDFSDPDSLLRVNLRSDHTPHGLRAGFVSEAIRFLPPSIIGQFLTGQTEQLVSYYNIVDLNDVPTHQQLLAKYLVNNVESISHGETPELAQALLTLNARLAKDIEENPGRAIETHGLVSLAGVKAESNGIDVLRAKRFTNICYNRTHICPFGNKCPQEVVTDYGPDQPCDICPYAARGVAHLIPISAEKDKCKEMQIGIIKKIKALTSRKGYKGTDEFEQLNKEHDKIARQSYALEAIEHQLYEMAKNGQYESFFVRDKTSLSDFFQRVEISDAEYLVKRLVDTQNFPDVTSAELDTKFAYMRAILLMQEGSLEELLKVGTETVGNQLGAQLASMLQVGSVDLTDLLNQVNSYLSPAKLVAKPESTITKIALI